MAQGIRTINGYTNNYPTVSGTAASWAIGTAVWNTTYVNVSNVTSITITIPAYSLNDGSKEIRIIFKTGSSITFTPTINSAFTVKYGFSDLSLSANKIYELSIIPFVADTITCVCKEWS